ncbi:PREDICTED: long-chain-fatty-acid--CoA ligase 6-like [Branchiostoma belcheri]|uniref:Long-chain-fatty-acid--CoA ligase n=1 Tax=Branchiostoma belcheri TaxID=7741 RepID=A0A6P4Z176_BRABE|nr:PREDICTED: long-chain-fatty-acid--CoA ligase 6-like [Branchiostoma belcheri]
MGAGGTKGKDTAPATKLARQSVEVKGDEYAKMSCHNQDGKLVDHYFDDVRTLHQAFMRGVGLNRNGPCLGWRPGVLAPYEWMTYHEVYTRAYNFGSGVVHKGLQPGTKTSMGIFSQNRPEWAIAEQGCNMFSIVVVPLYDTLGAEAVQHIINQAELRTVVCDVPAKVTKLLSYADGAADNILERIIVIEPITNEETLAQAEELGVEILTFNDVEQMGANNPQTKLPPKPEDLATICYTSGTTGTPKGALLTHSNLIACNSGILHACQRYLSFNKDDVHISYLPLAHMFERQALTLLFSVGAKVGFFTGDIKLLADDMMALKPTFFITVPRLLNRLYDRAWTLVQGSAFKTKMLHKALNAKKELLNKGICRNDTIWDTLIFRRARARTGGNVRFVAVGAAPLSEEVLTFARCLFGCTVLEGYGQTECAAAATTTMIGDYTTGHVGAPIQCTMIKLVDVPEMDYYAKQQKGEVCFKGPNVFQGYLKNPEKTAEALDSDGWLHTGDIGAWLPCGQLRIIDRKKDIFKLAQGEYIAPEKVENVYVRSPLVAQVFVHGVSIKSSLVAIVVPDPDVLPGWAKTNQSIEGDMETLCANKDIKDAIMADLNRMAKEGGLKSFEQVKQIHLHHKLFTTEDDLLTPTFKLKRPQARKYFAKELEEIYALVP